MMKELYEALEMELVEFTVDDIITTSGEVTGKDEDIDWSENW